jgi:hypothetical protein
MNLRKSWRIAAMSLVGVSLLTAASISFAGAQSNASGNRAASAPTVVKNIHQSTVKLGGVVDLRTLPTITAGTQTNGTASPARDRMTPAERQAYRDSLKTDPRVSRASAGQGMALARSPNAGPSFVGGGVTPLFVRAVDGLNSVQSGCGCVPPDQALATDLSYVMEGVNNVVAIYLASTGALKFGPYSAQSFFSPVFHAGDSFSDPQMDYDVMHDRWIVTWLEIDPSGTFDYLDIAVSQTNSPTQPAPGAQYNIYQITTNFEPSGPTKSFCDYDTLGNDTWSLDITCVDFRGGFVGNTQILFRKGPMLSGLGTTFYTVNDALQISGGAAPAFRLSPATEDGVQDAEFFVSTDAGYGGPSSNMGICAWTNLRNLDTMGPTVTCQNVNLGSNYTDPLLARQSGGPNNIDPGLGPKQVYFKGGRLYIAQSAAIGGVQDGIFWAEVQPKLTTQAAHNPQWINGAVITQTGNSFYADSTIDTYMPTIMGTDENDISLVYNYSGASIFPGIVVTGRKSTDANGIMGQLAGSYFVAVGTHTHTTGRWGDYSACAISLNSVTRGGIWCGGEYAGPVANPGWNTRLYNIRTE